MAEKYVKQAWKDLDKAFPLSAAREVHQEDGIEKAQQTGEEAATNSLPLAQVGVSVPSTEQPLKIKGVPTTGWVLTATSGTTAKWEPSTGGITKPEAETVATLKQKVHAVVSTEVTAAINELTPVNAEAETRIVKLPTGQPQGSMIAIEKNDGTSNAVKVKGLLRENKEGTIELNLAKEMMVFLADASGFWWPWAGHKSKSSLETLFVTKAEKGVAGGVPESTEALKITNAPTVGQILHATSATAAAWFTGEGAPGAEGPPGKAELPVWNVAKFWGFVNLTESKFIFKKVPGITGIAVGSEVLGVGVAAGTKVTSIKGPVSGLYEVEVGTALTINRTKGEVYEARTKLPVQKEVEYIGNIQAEDDSVRKLTRISIRNEVVWMQHHGVTTKNISGTTDMAPQIQNCVELATTFNESGTGVVCGEPGIYWLNSTQVQSYSGFESAYEKRNTAVFLREAVSLGGLSSKGMEFRAGPALNVEGNVMFGLPPGGNDSVDLLFNVKMGTLESEGASRTFTTTPNPRCDAILAAGSGCLRNVSARGAFRYALNMAADHFYSRYCEFGGWSAIGVSNGQRLGGVGNISFLQTNIVSGFSNIFVLPGSYMGGWAFIYGHMGICNGPVIYAKESAKEGDVLMSGVSFWNTDFEEGGRGLIYDETETRTVQKVVWESCLAGGGEQALLGGRLKGDLAQPVDALVRCGSFVENKVLGRGEIFGNSGYEPEYAAVLKAKTIAKNELGEMGGVLASAEALGVPILKAETQFGNTAVVTEGNQKTSIFFRTLPSGVTRAEKGALMQRVGEKTPKGTWAKPFAQAGGWSAGVAQSQTPEYVTTTLKANVTLPAATIEVNNPTLTKPLPLTKFRIIINGNQEVIVGKRTGEKLEECTGGSGLVKIGQTVEWGPGINGLHVPCGVPNPLSPTGLSVNTSRLSRGELISGEKFPPTKPTKVTGITLAAELKLGEGRACPMNLHQVSFAQQKEPEAFEESVYLTGMADFPVGAGKGSMGSTIFTWVKSREVGPGEEVGEGRKLPLGYRQAVLEEARGPVKSGRGIYTALCRVAELSGFGTKPKLISEGGSKVEQEETWYHEVTNEAKEKEIALEGGGGAIKVKEGANEFFIVFQGLQEKSSVVGKEVAMSGTYNIELSEGAWSWGETGEVVVSPGTATPQTIKYGKIKRTFVTSKLPQMEEKATLEECTGGAGTLKVGQPVVLVGSPKYMWGVTSSGNEGKADPKAGAEVIALSSVRISTNGDGWSESAASLYRGGSANYEAFRMNKSAKGGHERGIIMNVTNEKGKFAGATGPVVGGAVLETEVASIVGAVALKAKGSIERFPNHMKLLLYNSENKPVEVEYKAINYATREFTSLTVISGSGKINVGEPIVAAPGGLVAVGQVVRPAYATGEENAGNIGIVVASSGPGDTKGYPLSVARSADEGAYVEVDY